MVTISYKQKQMRNAPKQITQQLGDIVRQAKTIKGIYSLILVNPFDQEHHQILCIIEDNNKVAEKKALELSSSFCTAKTIFWSHFWLHLNNKNAIVLEYLRKGAILFDNGYASPLQELLFQGKLRPSKEATWNEMLASQEAMKRANNHIKQAVVDLYWCMVDCAHALLATLGEVAPSPKNMKTLLNEKVVKRNLLRKEHVDNFEEVFLVAKRIDHGEVFELSGRDYEELEKKAQHFLTDVKELIKELSKIS
ncbi:hypothetical protein D6774_02710 [Candidatus Woesearchaeota archaeon]|nr:MAG: hypothetical protein D6774_02710 [Candidatus Woesearchaeota archaeon]